MTLPRLELMGALIGARLGSYLSNLLNINDVNTFYWTDSVIALHWIKCQAELWKPFVQNGVIEIQNLTLSENWRHRNGNENPADRGTRGVSVRTFGEDLLRWKGPMWLHISSWRRWHGGTKVLCVEKGHRRRKRGGNTSRTTDTDAFVPDCV